MIIIADSGATKTDWRILKDDRTSVHFDTKGLNPFFSTPEDFFIALQNGFPIYIDRHNINEVFFYGAGCAGQEKGLQAQHAISRFFDNARVFVFSDLLAAARSLFGNKPGVVAILGTGSNIAYYNGSDVRHYTPSLGYILGDDGSGTYICRHLLKSYFYNQLPADLSAALSDQYNVELSFVLDRIYSQPQPTSFLASFIPFVHENINNPVISMIVRQSFEDLYDNHLVTIPELSSCGLGVVGSVGYIFRDLIKELAIEKGFKLHEFVQYPIEKLQDYHFANRSV